MAVFETIPRAEVPRHRKNGTGLADAIRALTPKNALRIPLDGATAAKHQVRLHHAAADAKVAVRTTSDAEYVYVWLRDGGDA